MTMVKLSLLNKLDLVYNLFINLNHMSMLGPDQSFSFTEGKKKESIRERKEIKAPAGFVSVYHETTAAAIPTIDSNGLRHGSEKNMSGAEAMDKRNQMIDKYRPEHLIRLGISRNNLFAYPYLQYGHGLMGADLRHVGLHKSEAGLRMMYGGDMFERMSSFWLEDHGIKTEDELIAKLQDPKFQRELHPEGEILEFKVDPKTSYVGDMEYITRIYDNMQRFRFSEDEEVAYQAKQYWEGVVSLEDFLKWYKKPEYAEDGNNYENPEQFKQEPFGGWSFQLLKGAPEGLPEQIQIPEIMIPQDIPQEHIRMLE